MKKTTSWLYNLALLSAGLVFLPKILYQRSRYGKYKASLPAKWGKEFQAIQKGKHLFWIHAVSLGETKAITPFAKQLKEKYPEADLLLTTATETGHAEGKKGMPFAKYHMFLPFDFSWVIGPILNQVKPDLIVLTETDFWYHFLKKSKAQGAKIAVVNGKMSDRSLKRYKMLTKILNDFFDPIDCFCMQSERYADKLKELGIPAEKIEVSGNIKLDAPTKALNDKELTELKKQFHLESQDLILVAGSTHNPEEDILLNAFTTLSKEFPPLKLFIVPRHPERFPEVIQKVAKTGLPYTTYSTFANAKGDEKVIVIDGMGLLKTCYQLATVTFVGGSFASHVGGHNILEPSAYGKPVLFGPYMQTQMDFVDLIKAYDAGIQLQKEEELIPIIKKLLHSEELRSKLGKAGEKLTQEMQGATQRSVRMIENLLNK